MNSDVCKRIVTHPNLMSGIVEKLLEDDFASAMQACQRPQLSPPIPAATFVDDFGNLLQFLSTMMVFRDYHEMHPRFNELIPKLQAWQTTYQGIFIGQVAGRIRMQLTMDPTMVDIMKEQMKEALVCGDPTCRQREGLVACAGCNIQRYCGKTHQKKDWKYHKQICNKGLVEPDAA